MGILFTAVPVHRNVRPLNEKSQPVAGAQADGRWTQGVHHMGRVGADAATALDPGLLAECGQCRLVPAGLSVCPPTLQAWFWAQCWEAWGSPWANAPLG